MAEHTEVAPLLPPASVDFNALHDACVAGKSAEEAVEAAVFAETLASPADGAETVPPADEGTDGLEKLTKADLKGLLDNRPVPVAYESDANHARLLELVRENPARRLRRSTPPDRSLRLGDPHDGRSYLPRRTGDQGAESPGSYAQPDLE
jgi:hypothetical protein